MVNKIKHRKEAEYISKTTGQQVCREESDCRVTEGEMSAGPPQGMEDAGRQPRVVTSKEGGHFKRFLINPRS